MRFSLGEAARIARGALLAGSPDTPLSGVSVDSRQVCPGDLFVALAGDQVDGHEFVEAAFRAGAAAALVSRMPAAVPERAGLLEVPDVLSALRQLATWTRDEVDPVVVGITGSTGKTSTKELLSAVGAVRFRTVAAERSYNNDLGVPLTMLKANPDTQLLICELGARGVGQIAGLCRFVRPTIGIVTNVGVTHYEQFGSVEAILATKSELPASLAETGVAVLNADDPRVAGMASATRAQVLSYGLDRRAWLRADDIEVDRLGRASFRLVRGAERVEVKLAVSGRHQVSNALAAATAGLAMGMSLQEVASGLRHARNSPWRMEVTDLGGVLVVNDAYNANPTSMQAALQTCAGMVPPGGRLLAVLGFMAELGALEEREHARMGALAAGLVQRLVVVGQRAGPLAEGARAGGLHDVRLVAGGPERGSPEDVLDALGEIAPGDVVLVKASRVAGLERLAALLEARLASQDGAGARSAR